MKPRELARTAWRTAVASRTSSMLTLLLVAAMCASVIATVGRSAVAQREVLERWEQAGARRLSISANPLGAPVLTPAALAQVRGLSTVESVIGVAEPNDVTNAAVGAGGPHLPSWVVMGDLSDAFELVQGRWPHRGEALVAHGEHGRLGMDAPFGAVGRVTTLSEESWPIVGSYRARPGYDLLGRGVVIAADPDAVAATFMVVLTSPDVVQSTVRAIVNVLKPAALGDLTIESPASLAELRQGVAGDLGHLARSLLLALLAGGGALIGVVVFADALVRRADLGRRRALGATRAVIVALVVLRTALAGVAGAVIGIGAGWWVAWRMGAVVEWKFCVAVAVLALITTLLAAVAPALFAATRDPVRVLRTP